jgi:hypothetical protein
MNGIISIGLQVTSSGSGRARTADTAAAALVRPRRARLTHVRHIYARACSRLCQSIITPV